jgi:HK97 family phage major capsid protein/HK97 family phage prohead protease
MTRLKGGANVLFGHDTDKILGVVEDAYIVENKLFVKVKFSKNDDFAIRIYKDILDGVIKNVSIGYQVLDYHDEKKDGRVYRYVTKFEIFETSIVAVPADATVGIRSLETSNAKIAEMAREIETLNAKIKELEEPPKDEEKSQDEEKPAETPAEDEKKSCDDDDKETKSEAIDDDAINDDAEEIKACGDALGVPAEEQEKAIKSGMTAREFKKNFRNYNNSNNITIKEKKMTKFAEYLRAGNFQDKFVLTRDAYPGFGGQAGEGGAGAIGTETKPLVEALTKIMGVKGYRTLTGLTSNISIPVQTGRNAIYQTEHLRDAASASAPVLTPVTLSPVKLSGNTRIGKELLVQANDDIEAFIIDSLTKEIAYKVEDYLLGKVAAGASGSVTYSALGAIDWDDILAFEASIGGFNLETPAFVMSPSARAALKGIPKAANYPEFLCSGFNEINGYKCNVSGVVSNNDIYFGDWSKLLLGVWGQGLEILVNPFSYAKEGDVEIVASLCIDAAVLQGDAFVLGAVEASSSSSN